MAGYVPSPQWVAEMWGALNSVYSDFPYTDTPVLELIHTLGPSSLPLPPSLLNHLIVPHSPCHSKEALSGFPLAYPKCQPRASLTALALWGPY